MALWRAVLAALTERPAMEKELVAAERRLAEDTTARNLGRLNAVKTQTAAARGAPANAPERGAGNANTLPGEREANR